MASRNSAWFLVAIWTQSICNAASKPPSEVCTSMKASGSWHDFSLTIPGEAAPDNVLAVRARCHTEPYDRFMQCDAKLDDGQKIRAASWRSYSFLGKSGKRHALSCPPDGEPAIVPAFATDVCKSSKSEIRSKDCNVWESTKDYLNVDFKCNAANDQIISCKAKGQNDWADAKTKLIAYFGGKGKLYSIECTPYDQPEITIRYPRDVCSADKQDKIAVEGEKGSGTVTVYFECNAGNDRILKCFPGNKITATPVVIDKNSMGTIGMFNVGILNKEKFKEIFCWKFEKPTIRQRYEPLTFGPLFE